jgi:AcrR family transcriptional regulator
MPASETARPSPAQRLELIEHAATQLFAERGFAATTVDDIAKAAGLTKPMLYRHFESKQELCVALLTRARADLIEAPLARFRPGMPEPQAQVPAMVDAWFEHVQRHPHDARLLFTPITGDPEVERVQMELHALQTATQAALLRELAPELEDVETEALATLMRASLGAIALWWLERPEVPREVPVRALLRSFRGIYTGFGESDVTPVRSDSDEVSTTEIHAKES